MKKSPDTTGEVVYDLIPPKNPFILFILYTRFLMVFPFFRWIIKKYLKSSSNIEFTPGFRFLYGNIFAKDCYLCDTFIADYAPVYIGKNSKFSWDNMIITSTHDRNDFTKVRAKPVYIGENVWVTTRCIILGGVHIGDNSIIAAGSVVVNDIPADSIAAGNPARVIGHV